MNPLNYLESEQIRKYEKYIFLLPINNVFVVIFSCFQQKQERVNISQKFYKSYEGNVDKYWNRDRVLGLN